MASSAERLSMYRAKIVPIDGGESRAKEEPELPIIPKGCINFDACPKAQEAILEQLEDVATRTGVEDSEIIVYCTPSSWYSTSKRQISAAHHFSPSYPNVLASSKPSRKYDVECPNNQFSES